MASLQQYVENCGRWLECTTFVLSDNNGVEIASWGEKLEDLQLSCAIFQSSVDNLAKLSNIDESSLKHIKGIYKRAHHANLYETKIEFSY